jgi:hypothetical protein
MGPLVATADRPPGDLMSELSALSQAKEIGYDADTQNQALSWRLLRQPEDWDALVDDAYARCDKVMGMRLSLPQLQRVVGGVVVHCATLLGRPATQAPARLQWTCWEMHFTDDLCLWCGADLTVVLLCPDLACCLVTRAADLAAGGDCHSHPPGQGV